MTNTSQLDRRNIRNSNSKFQVSKELHVLNKQSALAVAKANLAEAEATGAPNYVLCGLHNVCGALEHNICKLKEQIEAERSTTEQAESFVSQARRANGLDLVQLKAA